MKNEPSNDRVKLLLDILLLKPFNDAVAKLLNVRHRNKRCRCTTHIGSNDIVMIVQRHPLSESDGIKKERYVFEVTIWIKRFVRVARHKLKRITEVFRYERAQFIDLPATGSAFN